MEKIITITEDLDKKISLNVDGFTKIEVIGLLSYYHQFFSTELYKETLNQTNPSHDTNTKG